MSKQKKKESGSSLALRKPGTLSLASPSDVMGFGQTLKAFITQNKLSVVIQGNEYAMVDGWKFALMNFGLTPIPSKPVAVHKDGQYITRLYQPKEFTDKGGKKYVKDVVVFVGYAHHRKVIDDICARTKISREITSPYFAYENDCNIVSLKSHKQVSRGTGFCSNLETLKSGFDEYSIISMTETRSIGKGARNLIGFVMNAAGMKATPAEEMDQDMETFSQFTVVPGKGKPKLDASQYPGIMKKVISGQMSLQDVSMEFTLDEEQEAALKIAEQSKQPKSK